MAFAVIRLIFVSQDLEQNGGVKCMLLSATFLPHEVIIAYLHPRVPIQLHTTILMTFA